VDSGDDDDDDDDDDDTNYDNTDGYGVGNLNEHCRLLGI